MRVTSLVLAGTVSANYFVYDSPKRAVHPTVTLLSPAAAAANSTFGNGTFINGTYYGNCTGWNSSSPWSRNSTGFFNTTCLVPNGTYVNGTFYNGTSVNGTYTNETYTNSSVITSTWSPKTAKPTTSTATKTGKHQDLGDGTEKKNGATEISVSLGAAVIAAGSLLL